MEKNYSPHIKPDVTTASATVKLSKMLLFNAKEALAKYLTREREREWRIRLAGKGTGIMKCDCVFAIFFENDVSLHKAVGRIHDGSDLKSSTGLSLAMKYYWSYPALLKLYAPLDDAKALLCALVQEPNDCILEECEGLLTEHKV
ncbi:hypothetical protein BC937DRAFT_94938 [Endogone sp. FLAS-F59071]|nr:hypothetical protein BC937DRAFT_94938 [Endogone sp. FLAS-F59071]|eukprot:RUS20563.1 hypothetical protein BC937DRAFT_94938 [Endogone sp. FLAS-F59071]